MSETNTGRPAEAFEHDLARALRDEAYRVPHHLTPEILQRRRLERAPRQALPGRRWLGLAAAVVLMAAIAIAAPFVAPSVLDGIGGPAPVPAPAYPVATASAEPCLRGEYRLTPAEGGPDTVHAREATRRIIQLRLEEAGFGEATARVDGDRIIVEVPFGAESERVQELVGRTGRFQILPLPPETQVTEGAPVPPGLDVLLTGEQVESVESGEDQIGEATLDIAFDSEGSRLFADHTRDGVGERIILAVDDVVISAPTIMAPIEGGEVAISGELADIDDLVIILRHGALPISVEETSFGLGACG